MARRRYTRYRRRKGRWSANIQRLINWTAPPNLVIFSQKSTVSQQYTVKNIEVAGQLEIETSTASSNLADIEELTYYIICSRRICH